MKFFLMAVCALALAAGSCSSHDVMSKEPTRPATVGESPKREIAHGPLWLATAMCVAGAVSMVFRGRYDLKGLRKQGS